MPVRKKKKNTSISNDNQYNIRVFCPSYSILEGHLLDINQNFITLSYKRDGSSKKDISKFSLKNVISIIGNIGEEAKVIIFNKNMEIEKRLFKKYFGTSEEDEFGMLNINTSEGVSVRINPDFGNIVAEDKEANKNLKPRGRRPKAEPSIKNKKEVNKQTKKTNTKKNTKENKW